MRISDWSSDVCSSDLIDALALRFESAEHAQRRNARDIAVDPGILALGAGHVRDDVADDVDAADLRQPRARLGPEDLAARVWLDILDDGRSILSAARPRQPAEMAAPNQTAGNANVLAHGSAAV